MANTSPAVLAQRKTQIETYDFYPTPPWAVRAMFEYLLPKFMYGKATTIYEPACGMGDMSKVLSEYSDNVISSDIGDYGFGSVQNFLSPDFKGSKTPTRDWLITNPPFKLALDFALKAVGAITIRNYDSIGGVAIFERLQWLESVKRYTQLFSIHPPDKVGVFSERVPLVAGKLDPAANAAVAYCWIIWFPGDPDYTHKTKTQLDWIPVCRNRLTKPGDYDNQNYTNLDVTQQLDLEDKSNGPTFNN